MPTNNEKLKLACLFALTCIAVTGSLIYTKSVLIPFIMAFFLYSVTSPAMDWLEDRFKVHRMVSLFLTVGVSLLVMSLVTLILIHSLEDFIRGADIYKERVVTLVQKGSLLFKKYGVEVNSASIKKQISELPVLSIVKQMTGGVLSFVSNLFIVLVFSIFMLMGEGVTRIKNKTLKQIHLKISQYVVGKFTLSILTGVIVGVLLFSFNVELALLFAILTILFNFIPNIGSIIATAIPLPVVFLQYGFGFKFFIILILSLLTQVIIGNIVEPKVMGDSMDLHPVTILVFLMFWGLVWGIPGMFMAVPITAILKITFSKIPTTKRFSELMAGRI